MKKLFCIGEHIWFILHFNHEGKMVGLEENTRRSLSKDVGKSWEETFVNSAVTRAEANLKQRVESAAVHFLYSDLLEVSV